MEADRRGREARVEQAGPGGTNHRERNAVQTLLAALVSGAAVVQRPVLSLGPAMTQRRRFPGDASRLICEAETQRRRGAEDGSDLGSSAEEDDKTHRVVRFDRLASASSGS